MLLVGLGWEVSAQQSITPHPAQLPWWHPTAGWALCPGVSPLCPPAFLPVGFSSHCGAREGQDRGLGRSGQPLTLSLSPGELEEPDKHWGLGREDWNPEPQPGECPAPRATTLCLGDTPLQARVTPSVPWDCLLVSWGHLSVPKCHLPAPQCHVQAPQGHAPATWDIFLHPYVTFLCPSTTSLHPSAITLHARATSLLPGVTSLHPTALWTTSLLPSVTSCVTPGLPPLPQGLPPILKCHLPALCCPLPAPQCHRVPPHVSLLHRGPRGAGAPDPGLQRAAGAGGP